MIVCTYAENHLGGGLPGQSSKKCSQQQKFNALSTSAIENEDFHVSFHQRMAVDAARSAHLLHASFRASTS
jgi:hypothetical protein